MSGFSNPVINNTNKLIRASIESPNFVAGISGWAINKDGTAQFNELTLIVQTSGAAVLIYAGAAGPGTLIGSWASSETTDQYGNDVPAGLNANQGSLSGINITNAQLVNATIIGALLQGPTVTQAAITGGTITETTILFDSTGGGLLVYSSTTTTVNFTTGGAISWPVPAGTNGIAKIECWGADAGAGGGSATRGGEAGGAGEYACEPNYPLPVAGTLIDGFVGFGGTGGTTGTGGGDGTDTAFDAGAVLAAAGQAGSAFIGGQGGNRSTNTIHFPGGNGGGDGSQSTGGCGGGGRAGSTGGGGNGLKSVGSTGANGGAAGTGTGGHAGGNGGNAAANGNNGGGGGGPGAATSATQGTNQYRLSSSATYYGSDGTTPNQKRANGTMYQGGETAGGGGFNGTQKSLGIVGGNPQTDLSGKTIDSVSIRLQNLHSWFNSGLSVQLGYTGISSLPSSYNGSGITNIKTFHMNEGAKSTIDLSNLGFGTALQSGAAQSIVLGPGPAFNLGYYGYFYGSGGDNSQNPLITVNWHTGASPVKGGDGADGRITVTYTNAQILVAAISPIAGADTSGNAFAVGYTGPVTAFQPASAPSVVEVWHDFPAGINSWGLGTGGWKKYRMLSTGSVEISMSLRNIGTKTDGTAILAAGALPAGYQPGSITGARKLLPLSMDTSAATFYGANHTPYMSFNTDGSVTIFGVNATGLNVVDCHGIIPLI